MAVVLLTHSRCLFIKRDYFCRFGPAPDISGQARRGVRTHACVSQPRKRLLTSQKGQRGAHPDPSVDTGHTFTRHRAGSAPIRPKANGSQFMGQQQDAGQSQNLIRNSEITFLYTMLID